MDIWRERERERHIQIYSKNGRILEECLAKNGRSNFHAASERMIGKVGKTFICLHFLFSRY
jgi:hypothetical protein